MISADIKADVKQQEIKIVAIYYNFYKKYLQNLNKMHNFLH